MADRMRNKGTRAPHGGSRVGLPGLYVAATARVMPTPLEAWLAPRTSCPNDWCDGCVVGVDADFITCSEGCEVERA